MSTFTIDSKAMQLKATGVVQPVYDWVETADGKRKPGDVQSVTESGHPIWNVECIRTVEVWGRISSVPFMVQLPSRQEPRLVPFSPIELTDAQVTVSVLKDTRALRESWVAGGIANATSAPAAPPAGKAAA